MLRRRYSSNSRNFNQDLEVNQHESQKVDYEKHTPSKVDNPHMIRQIFRSKNMNISSNRLKYFDRTKDFKFDLVRTNQNCPSFHCKRQELREVDLNQICPSENCSVEDLSEIVNIDVCSSSQKKSLHLLRDWKELSQEKQNTCSATQQDISNASAIKIQKNFKNQQKLIDMSTFEDENSQEIQVMNIWCDRVIKNSERHQRNIEDDRFEKRRYGSIRKNSVSSIQKKEYESKIQSISRAEKMLSSITSKQNFKQMYPSNKGAEVQMKSFITLKRPSDGSNTKYLDPQVPILLFDKLSGRKKFLENTDISMNQQIPVELKFILGPVLCKIKQNKIPFNYEEFKRSFEEICTDLSTEQVHQVHDQIRKFAHSSSAIQLPKQRESCLDLTVGSKIQTENKNLFSHKKSSSLRSHERLKHLHHKIDCYIDRIENSNTFQSIVEFGAVNDNSRLKNSSKNRNIQTTTHSKERVSTLMSELSSIKEISEDSDQWNSKEQNELTVVCEESQNRDSFVLDSLESSPVRGQPNQRPYQGLFAQRQAGSYQLIHNSTTLKPQSKTKNSSNDSVERQRQSIWESQIVFNDMFPSVNLSFKELSKYRVL